MFITLNGCGFFVAGMSSMSSYSSSTSLAVLNNMTLGKRMRSHVFLVCRVGSRNLHHIRWSKTDFNLILSNSNADSKSLKHELLLQSAVARCDRLALNLVIELDKEHLEVYWVLMNLGAFISG